MDFRLVPKSVTLNDLKWHNNHSQVAAVHPFELSWAVIISEIISQCATCFFLCEDGIMLFIDKLFVFKSVFYVVLFELMVKKFTVISFATIIDNSYWSSDANTKQSARFVLLRKYGHV